MRRAGFTLVELLLALGLFSVLMLALVRLSDTALTIWDDTERGRELSELGAQVLEALARDPRALERGATGDLVCAWEPRDLDQDGLAGLVVPRLGLVRSRSAAEAARAAVQPGGEPDGPGGLPGHAPSAERVEVLWSFAPASSDPDATLALLRAERVPGDEGTPSLLALAVSAGDAERVAALSDEVAHGVLWLSFWFASTSSVLADGWRLGEGLADCGASWDAWARERPERERSGFNDPAPGVRGPTDVPLLPRRVRIELELERARDLVRRPRLARALEPGETVLFVADARALPAPAARPTRRRYAGGCPARGHAAARATRDGRARAPRGGAGALRPALRAGGAALRRP